MDNNSTFQKTSQQLSIILKEDNLPKLNYENISIRCSPILDDSTLITVERTCLTLTSNSILNCSCDQLRAATKYQVTLITKKTGWISREFKMEDQYTGISFLSITLFFNFYCLKKEFLTLLYGNNNCYFIIFTF